MTPGVLNRMVACGPVLDQKAADRIRSLLQDKGHWTADLDAVWMALAPILGASPYLSSLVRADPSRLTRLGTVSPETALDTVLVQARSAAAMPDLEAARQRLRQLKGDLHLLCALCDLGGLWDLDQVTGALSKFADIVVQVALTLAVREETAKGRLAGGSGTDTDGLPGFFCLAMGKHGAFELNYSSDIDITVFFEPNILAVVDRDQVQSVANSLALSMSRTLQERTVDGYVFRVDLRLRPDPSSTPLAVSLPAAYEYYETVGQNWERAAFIKARFVAGDPTLASQFLADMTAFIWRKTLDFAAIADIHSIKRQIHAHKVDERLDAQGADLKLGRGGIREIEFFVQTQQLILGGRHPELRSARTLDALEALCRYGQVTRDSADFLARAYRDLRALEHRIQMLADEQTHRLPESDRDRKAVAALFGYSSLRSFDAAISRMLRGVNGRYAQLFAGEEELSSRFGSLIFTGVDDDPETLKTLTRMGFSSPSSVSGTIRGWHHGRIAATRTERGRELFTRLAPRLLDALSDTRAPDQAFNQFSDFFSGLRSGVQVQSLFLAQPRMLALVLEVMAFAPRLASVLSRRPAALDALLDPGFFDPVRPEEMSSALDLALQHVQDFEAAMDAVRRAHREQDFRIGVQVMSGTASAREAGRAFADLADACIERLAQATLHEITRQAGAFPGQIAVIALGKCGSREMTATSDLDLMTLYRPEADDLVSSLKEWPAAVYYGRFTQRLIAALSAPTSEGSLYEVDMKLRPTGSKGPVSVSMAAFGDYYAGEAETWEFQALTRARVVWASSEVLAMPRDPAATARDIIEMRKLMEAERPARSDWDLKLMAGGLVDIEFATQYLGLIAASRGAGLPSHTVEALQARGQSGDADPSDVELLAREWQFQQDLSQLLKVALGNDGDPALAPLPFKRLLARAGGVRDFRSLKARLARSRKQVRAAFERVLNSDPSHTP